MVELVAQHAELSRIESEIHAAIVEPALERSGALSVLPIGAVTRQLPSLAARAAEARIALAALEAEIGYCRQHPACADAQRPLAIMQTRWRHWSELVQTVMAAADVRDALAELAEVEPESFWDAYWAAMLPSPSDDERQHALAQAHNATASSTNISDAAREFLADAAQTLMKKTNRRLSLDALRRRQQALTTQAARPETARRAIIALFSANVGSERAAKAVTFR